MLHRPALQQHVRSLAVDGEGAVLLMDGDDRILPGDLFARLVPLLDGSCTTEEIVERLDPTCAGPEVLFAIMQLEESGVLVDAGDFALPPMQLSGVALDAVAGMTLAISDSYLRPELAEINALHLRTGQPWVLARPGVVTWVGPVMRPGLTACWTCLEHRLRRNLPFEYQRVRQENGLEHGGDAPRGAMSSLRAVVEGEVADLDSTMLTIDARDGARRVTLVSRRPQCPACGDVRLYAGQADRAPRLAPQPKRHTTDGGHRGAAPAESVRLFRVHLDRWTGVVRDVRQETPAAPGAPQVCIAHYGADPAFATAPALERGLRLASGKGMTPDQVLASAMGEAIERYSSLYQGDEPRRRARLRDLGDAAIEPNAFMQFSATQFAEREARNARASRWDWIPRRLDPDETIEWSPVWSLLSGERRLLPTSLLYGGYPEATDACCPFDPNGNAAGITREEATLQGLLELIERDSLAIWWYNRLPRPGVDPESLDLPWCRDLMAAYRAEGREVWLLDITTDLAVPAFAAVSRNTGNGSHAPLFGFGAHLDARVAASRALTELHQIHGHVQEAGTTGRALDPALAKWLAHAIMAPWMAPSAAPPARIGGLASAASSDLAEDIRYCAGRFAQAGLEAYVLDQTRPDIGVPVVKAVVPGLRHLRSRFAPGRLYDVPVAMGWLPAPRSEQELNPITFFL